METPSGQTRLIEFRRFAAEDRKRRGQGKPETFNFLGFTHICAKNRKTGGFSVDRKTIRKRLSAKRKAVGEELRRRWHEPVAEIGKWLRSMVQGYFNCYAVPGNVDSLQSFRAQVDPPGGPVPPSLWDAAQASVALWAFLHGAVALEAASDSFSKNGKAVRLYVVNLSDHLTSGQ